MGPELVNIMNEKAEDLKIDEKKRLVKEPKTILECKTKKLRDKKIDLVLVRKHSLSPNLTWEIKEVAMKRYPGIIDFENGDNEFNKIDTNLQQFPRLSSAGAEENGVGVLEFVGDQATKSILTCNNFLSAAEAEEYGVGVVEFVAGGVCWYFAINCYEIWTKTIHLTRPRPRPVYYETELFVLQETTYI
ncbi:hypothetical protein LXL04_026237 [Taraxacum kok-saghyz]